MKYYRCLCGEAYGWSKTEFAKCEGCSKCQTTVATAPGEHKPLNPHEFKTMQDDAGNVKEICIFCGKTQILPAIENPKS